jgi:hypothetical protein
MAKKSRIVRHASASGANFELSDEETASLAALLSRVSPNWTQIGSKNKEGVE